MNANLSQTRELYQQALGDLQAIILSHVPPLAYSDVDTILSVLTSRLSEFTGAGESEFKQWAEELIGSAIQRFVMVYEILTYSRMIRATIRRTLGDISNFTAEPDAIVNDVYDKTLLTILQKKLDVLIIQGSAKLSTRVCELGAWQAKAWLKQQIQRRDAVRRRVARGMPIYAEILPVEEIRAEKAALRAEAWD